MINAKISCLLILITTTVILQNIDDLEIRTKKTPGIFYILQWTRGGSYYDRGQNSFRRCEYQNCFITDQIDYLNDVVDYDAVLFYPWQPHCEIPRARAENQMYVFVSRESATNYPVRCYTRFNWFFNYTWTYKLTSDIPNLYVSVRNRTSGKIIGPKKDMQWIDIKDMEPTELSIINTLQTKKFAAAWFVSNCNAKNRRFIYVNNLRAYLLYRNYNVHIYGRCGKMDCPLGKLDECLMKIKTDYHFYLSFENSFSEDYVTEKVIWALQNYAVPIVFGSANYSRFFPDGIYINAFGMNERALAEKMAELIEDKSKYYDFFRWHRYYSFHHSYESAETCELCALCAFLNGNWSEERRVYARFYEWWNEDEHEVPQTKTEDTIFYFDKPNKSQKPYINYNTKKGCWCWSDFYKKIYNDIARALGMFYISG